MVSLLNLTSVITIFLWQLLVVVSANEDGECPPSYDCGYLGQIKFPFTTARMYPVLKVDEPRTIIISDEELDKYLQNRSCKAFSNNLTLPHSSPLASFYNKYNITIFRCHHSLSNTSLPSYFHKYSNCSDQYFIYYANPNTQTTLPSDWPKSLAPCSTVQLTTQGLSTDDPFHFLTAAMVLELQLSDDCEKCLRLGKSQCLPDTKGKLYCEEHQNLAWRIGLGIGLPGIIIIGLLIIWRCKPTCVSDFYSNPYPETASIYYGIPVFTYRDLERATKRFDHSRELGQGGFGIVYHGKLNDGREVAVKRLYEHSHRRLEQFMNEIKILTRLRHTNLVSLYGCTSRRSRELLLVYEYISNGTVASHLHHEGSTNPGILPWPIRMKVAIETATALAYLHDSDIIHRDVKTNNILLDNTFCVKVADFGVSRLFPNDVTHVSTAPQGTPGYVDPEYHRSYQLTNKSDVYSFGVVLIELISSMPAIDMTRDKDEINLADLAIRKIHKSAIAELVDPFLDFESNSDVKRQITAVAELAFQCLQRDRELRPSMDQVLEVLRTIGSWKDENGYLEELKVDCQCPLPLTPPSPDHDEVNLLKNMNLLLSSPKAVTEKWDSHSTSPNVSGQSLSPV